MGNLSFLSGIVSHKTTISKTSGSVNNGEGAVATTHKTLFRVDGKPAIVDGTSNLGDGDKVILVGLQKGGEFKALAWRNDSIEIEYSEPTTLYYLLGSILVILGGLGFFMYPLRGIDPIILAFQILQALFIGGGIWIFSEGKKNQNALTMFRSGSPK